MRQYTGRDIDCQRKGALPGLLYPAYSFRVLFVCLVRFAGRRKHPAVPAVVLSAFGSAMGRAVL